MASRQAGMKIYTCALEPNSNFEAIQVKKTEIFIPPLTKLLRLCPNNQCLALKLISAFDCSSLPNK